MKIIKFGGIVNMSKKLAIKGHPTRGKEVIELLEMMGGKNKWFYNGSDVFVYFIEENDKYITFCGKECIKNTGEYIIYELEEFLEKYPYKVGDKVHIYVQNDDIDGRYDMEVAEISSMRWNPARRKIVYKMKDINREFYKEEIKCKVDDASNKMNDCKKCGLHFGSVRCFDKDCPHNKPQSFAVGLKDGEVIECGVNTEISMNEIKPLFKSGDVVKLKGCPDKNIFWIVMDVVKDGYIFNDGKKYSFDDQHHYEKTNREVINPMKNVLAELLEHIKTTSKEELEKEFNELEEWSNVGPTVEEFMDFCNKVNKKPVYPKTYDECCKNVLRMAHWGMTVDVPMHYSLLIINFTKLLICRDAYWKIAGEEMGLDKPWEPQFENCNIPHYCMFINHTGEVCYDCFYGSRCLLAFPTEEMRDAFYENFKDLIEQCKELL